MNVPPLPAGARLGFVHRRYRRDKQVQPRKGLLFWFGCFTVCSVATGSVQEAPCSHSSGSFSITLRLQTSPSGWCSPPGGGSCGLWSWCSLWGATSRSPHPRPVCSVPGKHTLRDL